MIIVGTIWGVITLAALIYGILTPYIEKEKALQRYKEWK